MGANAAPLEKLIEEFAKLPGIGRKGASRLAYQVLSMPKTEALEFAQAIIDAHTKIHRCSVCQNFTDGEICPICSGTKRDKSVICVVETPRDVSAFERTREYHGLYHVLQGLISPMNGVGPDDINLKSLLTRLMDNEVSEVIVATNATADGEATSMYISRVLKPAGIKVTRLARGLAVGADIEYADEVTLLRAIENRTEL